MLDRETKTLPLLAAYPFAATHGLADEAGEIRNLRTNSSVRRGHFVQLFREKDLLDEFIRQHWSFGSTGEGAKKLKYYDHLRTKHTSDSQVDEASADVDADEEEAEAHTFALESDLRDFLANNLSALEPGLQLYIDGSRKGVEFPVDNGYIDILAVDRNGKFVVIELKLSRGRNRALGQLLYYMGWVDTHKGNGSCRGIIVASEISEELRTAVQRVPGVTLARYRIAMSIEPIPTRAARSNER